VSLNVEHGKYFKTTVNKLVHFHISKNSTKYANNSATEIITTASR